MFRNFLVAGFCSLAVFAPSALSAQETTTAPDILLIAGDDLGAYLGCYGDPYAKTPNMDSIASQGVLFENGWVTQASCSPSRSSILTGLYPHQNGQVGLAHLGFSMSGEFDSIPSLLNKAGYFTGLVGKLHVKPESSFPFKYLKKLSGKSNRDMPKFAKHVSECLDQAGDKQLCLFASFADPHRPFNTQVKGFPKQPVTADKIALLPFMRGLEKVNGLQETVAGYYNAIMRMDAGVGMVVEKLKAAGRYDNTLVILIGDHGAPFGRGKVTSYNPSLRIPYIVKWPGVAKAGARSTALVSTIDILPTMLDAAGVDYQKDLPGKSLRPVVADPSKNTRDYMFAEFTAHLPADYYPARTVRNKRYQLIHYLMSDVPNPTPGIEGLAEREAIRDTDLGTSRARAAIEAYLHPPEYELFDLEKDPDNFVNLAGDPKYKEIQQTLASELMKWRRESNDPLLKEGAVKQLGEKIKATMDTKFSGVGDRPKK